MVWEKFINGDETALLELYNQHYLGLMNYGQMIVEDRELVNDCLTDMLVNFWKKRSNLPEVENVRSYLMTSLRRTIFNELQNNKKRDTRHSELQRLGENVQTSYEDYLIRIQSDNGLKAKITRALEQLTERQIELIRLKFFEDLDYDEIADQCGITKRTAYNIIYDALKILKTELQEDQNSSFQTPLSMAIGFLLIEFLLKKII
ncbi:MAG TPA: sigma-70 family RNA polymerase sigma factor [Flavisolibacter sp.]|nr:sigma-70 family RNA polymerase sigma factor [Flavisolibacter sp.]